jgi:hypothetical protein
MQHTTQAFVTDHALLRYQQRIQANATKEDVLREFTHARTITEKSLRSLVRRKRLDFFRATLSRGPAYWSTRKCLFVVEDEGWVNARGCGTKRIIVTVINLGRGCPGGNKSRGNRSREKSGREPPAERSKASWREKR